MPGWQLGAKGKFIKKAKKISEPELLEEYDFRAGVRGKYAQQFAEGSNVVVLSPDVAAAFPDSESVNQTLRMLIAIANQNTRPPTRP